MWRRFFALCGTTWQSMSFQDHRGVGIEQLKSMAAQSPRISPEPTTDGHPAMGLESEAAVPVNGTDRSQASSEQCGTSEKVISVSDGTF